MNVEDYQKIIKETAIYPKDIGIAYCALGLTGEAGEVAEKVKKLYRDKNLLGTNTISPDDTIAVVKEVSDVLWYVTALSNELGWSLSEVMQLNYDKLMSRRVNGTLSGSGDNR